MFLLLFIGESRKDKVIKKSRNSNIKLSNDSVLNNSKKNNVTKPVKPTSKSDQQTIEKEVETEQTHNDELTFVVPGFQDESDVKIKRETGKRRNQSNVLRPNSLLCLFATSFFFPITQLAVIAALLNSPLRNQRRKARN